jgi:hypothetical protein
MMQRKLLIATMLAILVAAALVVGAAIGAPSGTASTPLDDPPRLQHYL